MKAEPLFHPASGKPVTVKEPKLRLPRLTRRIAVAVAGPLAWIPTVRA